MYVAYVRCSHWRSKEVLFKVDAQASLWQPRSAKILHQYAVLLQAAGKLDEAKEYYEKAINVFDDNAMSDYCIARIWLEKNNCEEALKIFIKINSGHGIGFGDHNQFLLNNDFGYALVCMSAYHEAIPILEEALQLLNPNFEYVYNSLALALYETDRKHTQRVVDLLNWALQIHPTNFTLWYNLGCVLFQNGAQDDGKKAWVEAEKLAEKVFEYQSLQDGLNKLNAGNLDALKMLFLQLPRARG